MESRREGEGPDAGRRRCDAAGDRGATAQEGFGAPREGAADPTAQGDAADPRFGRGAEAPALVRLHTAPDVFLVRVPFKNISTSETNCYVIADGGETLVVDTGAPTEEGAEVLASALDELGVDLSRASFFLTHLHLDHAGLIDRVAPADAPVYVNRVDFDFMEAATFDGEFRAKAEAQVVAEGFDSDIVHRFARFGMGIRAFDPDGRDVRFVSEGDAIRVGSQELRVVDTAGHTPGHIALFHPASGFLFSGDHILFSISPGLGLRPGISDTMGIYLANLRKVLDLGPTRLLHSHGELRDDWRERVRWLIGHHEERVEQAFGLIAGRPGAKGAGVVRRLTWNVPMPFEKVNPAQKWCIVEGGVIILNHLVEQGRIVREPDSSGVNRYRVA